MKKKCFLHNKVEEFEALKNQHFKSSEEIKKWVDEWIASLTNDLFSQDIHSLPEQWKIIVENEGKYFS